MKKILISMSDQLASRIRSTIPARQRSKTIAKLIEKEIEKREKALFECALAVEKDSSLEKEMKDWDITIGDGLNNDSW
jgi:hypothetical protein